MIVIKTLQGNYPGVKTHFAISGNLTKANNREVNAFMFLTCSLVSAAHSLNIPFGGYTYRW